MIVLFRANGIFASRVSKYIDFYKKNNIEYKIIGWDRLGENIKKDNFEFFNYKTKYVQGGLKAIIAKIKWMFFVFKYLIKYKKNISTIHACDFDVAFPSVFFKLIYRKDVNIIFDVCDWASAGGIKNRIFYKILVRLERFVVNHSNSMIICEDERINQIQFEVPIEVYTMRNIPSFDNVEFLNSNVIVPFNNDIITVSYVGWFGNGRFLDELLDVAEKKLINLFIAGFGKSSIESRCKELDSKYENIRYFGKVDYKYGLQIMNSSDLIYAMYCKSVPNHYYAAPNKFYESMFLGKPILSNNGISLTDKINRLGIGYTINESIEELTDFFKSISKDELKEVGIKANKQWTYYSNLTNVFMDNTYSKIIK